jgi:hypothetical protein
MIIDVIKSKRHVGNGRGLGRYMLAAERERQDEGEKLGLYVTDARHQGEKLEWAAAANVRTEDPRLAVGMIAAHNSRNQRSQNKNMHIVASLPEGERLTPAQWHEVEAAAVKALGMERHPRLVAVHRNTAHQHMHMWVSRIHPVTHKAIHPPGDFYKLQNVAAGFEREYGLKLEPHTLNLAQTIERRQQQKIEQERQSLDRAHDQRHAEREAEVIDLDAWRAGLEQAQPRAQEPQERREAARVAAEAPAMPPTASGGRRRAQEAASEDDAAIRAIDAWRAGIEREWQGQGSPVKPIAPDPQRETENARLAREALLDRRADGKPRTIGETAFELSLDYRDALREIDGQKGAVAAAERQIKGAERSKEVAEYRVAERRQQMPGWRQALHKRGWVPDRDLGHWEGRVKAAERGIERGITHRTTARAALAMWERRAEMAFAAAEPAAVRELAQRQDRAKAARAELARRGLWIGDLEEVQGIERENLIAWHGFRRAELRKAAEQTKAIKEAQKAAPKQVRAQAPRPDDSEAWRARVKPAAAVQPTRPMKSETEEKEEAAQRYVRSLLERERSRPEYADEEEQKQVKRQRQGFRQRL